MANLWNYLFRFRITGDRAACAFVPAYDDVPRRLPGTPRCGAVQKDLRTIGRFDRPLRQARWLLIALDSSRALSSLLRRSINSLHPTINGDADEFAAAANAVFSPLEGQHVIIDQQALNILWSRSTPPPATAVMWVTNHVVAVYETPHAAGKIHVLYIITLLLTAGLF